MTRAEAQARANASIEAARQNKIADYVASQMRFHPRGLKFVQPNADLKTARDVMVYVGKAFGVTPEQIKGRSRSRDLIYARAAVVEILFRRGNSYMGIGRFLSRDHSTIIHARSMVPVYVEECGKIAKLVREAVGA